MPMSSVRAAVEWYFAKVYGQHEGPGTTPFYCDPTRVGAFAVSPTALANGDEAAIFRLFVTLSMYQALRDVVIMRQQLALPLVDVRTVADLGFVARSVGEHACSMLRSIEAFDTGCDVVKDRPQVDCGRHPGVACHIKASTAVFNRMGDMGKLPTSAWLRLWSQGGIRRVLADVVREESSPFARGELLVRRVAKVHRVGRKLATLFVSALSTPALAPGLTPWFPMVDGNELVVVDTNLSRAAAALRERGSHKTYDACVRWVRVCSSEIDLRDFRADLPRHSSRLVQQALYAFCSRSNRSARNDGCSTRTTPCEACAPQLCPFA